MVSSNHVIADALAAEAAKMNPGMVRALGGIDAFNIAFRELSKNNEEDDEEEESDDDDNDDDDDDDVEYSSDDPADWAGLHAEAADGENNDGAAGPPTKRTRRSFARKKKEESPWWRMYLEAS